MGKKSSIYYSLNKHGKSLQWSKAVPQGHKFEKIYPGCELIKNVFLL